MRDPVAALQTLGRMRRIAQTDQDSLLAGAMLTPWLAASDKTFRQLAGDQDFARIVHMVQYLLFLER